MQDARSQPPRSALKAHRNKLKAAEEHKRAMMSDRGVLMEELLLAQERALLADRASSRAVQRCERPPRLVSHSSFHLISAEKKR